LFRLLIGSICISFSPVFIKVADVDPDLAGFYRMFFAVLGLLPLFLLQREKLNLTRQGFLVLLACGFFLGIDFMFWHRSINLIGPGLSTLLGNFQVFFTALFSWLFLKEKVTGLFALAVVIAFCGLLFITGGDVFVLATTVKMGIIFGLLTAVFYSIYILLIKQAMTGSQVSGITATLIVSISCMLFLALFGGVKGISFAVTDSRSLLALAAVGLICTALGWSLISSAIKQVPATLAGLVLLLQPTLAFIWDVLFFRRPTGGYEYLGIMLILSAIYLGTQRRGN
jgi:drug/metabolite transporter (DMT)-like permease